MDPDEIFKYVLGGMKWLAIGGGSYINVLIGIGLVHSFSQRINSQKELKIVVDEEATKLGLDPTKIDVKYNGESNFVIKKGDRYDLHLKDDRSLTIAIIRHEIYHIHKGDSEHSSTLRYLLLEEPRALLYGSFKLKF